LTFPSWFWSRHSKTNFFRRENVNVLGRVVIKTPRFSNRGALALAREPVILAIAPHKSRASSTVMVAGRARLQSAWLQRYPLFGIA
jgi:hypothetical protein